MQAACARRPLPAFSMRADCRSALCAGVCLDVLKQLPNVPVLGVCLGFQALALVHGGRVVRAPEPVHGRLSELEHTGHPLMAGIPSGAGQGFDVVRCVNTGVLWHTLQGAGVGMGRNTTDPVCLAWHTPTFYR